MEHIFFKENVGCDQADNNGDGDRKPYAVEWHINDIHTIKAEDDIGDRHDNGYSSQYLHDDIKIIGNDASKGIHRS